MNTPSVFTVRYTLVVLCTLLAGHSMADAQVVISAPAPLPKRGEPAAKPANRLSNITSVLPNGLPLFARGPFVLRPHLRYRYIQANDIRATPVLAVDTTIQEFTPAVLLDIGKHWNITYTPTWHYYSNRYFHDSFDQSATLSGSGTHGRLGFGLTEGYTVTNETLVETGGQTHQELHSSGINLSYRLGDRTNILVDLNRSDRSVGEVEADPQWTTTDWLQWTASAWLTYEWSSKLTVGIGGTVGYDEIEAGPDMSYSRPQGRLTWNPSDKISLQVQAGAEVRRVKGGNSSAMRNPIYSGSFDYRPLPTTKLNATVSRGISASYFANRALRMVGWGVGFEQRLMQRVYFSSEYNENRTEYLTTGAELFPGDILGRDDVGRSFSVRLATRFLQQGSITVFYQQGRNTSDIYGYAFKSDQIGFEIAYQF